MTAGWASKVAVSSIPGARTVTWRATGFSADTSRLLADPGWIRIDSVVPSSWLGHDSSLRGTPR